MSPASVCPTEAACPRPCVNKLLKRRTDALWWLSEGYPIYIRSTSSYQHLWPTIFKPSNTQYCTQEEKKVKVGHTGACSVSPTKYPVIGEKLPCQRNENASSLPEGITETDPLIAARSWLLSNFIDVCVLINTGSCWSNQAHSVCCCTPNCFAVRLLSHVSHFSD